MVLLNGYDEWLTRGYYASNEHYPMCENFTGYYCKPCNHIIEVGKVSRNWCELCGKFARISTECICEIIESLDY